jgi:hypothetical protein
VNLLQSLSHFEKEMKITADFCEFLFFSGYYLLSPFNTDNVVMSRMMSWKRYVLKFKCIRRLIIYNNKFRSNAMVEWLTFLGSNLGPGDGHLIEGFLGFLQSLRANSGIVP